MVTLNQVAGLPNAGPDSALAINSERKTDSGA
jgi:hypothetical protein